MFSDELIGLDIAHRRELRQMGQQAQAMVDSLDGDVQRLRAKLRAAYAEIETERAARMAAELKVERLNRILDMPLN